MSATRPPAAPSQRIDAIDFVRGVGILGILVFNVQSYGAVAAAHLNPTVYGTLSGLDRWAWLAAFMFSGGKFLFMFAMLFGAGVLILAGRAGPSATRMHYRRMAVLAVIGALHAYLFWYAEMLFSFALVGMIVFPYRDLPPRRLFVAGVLFFAVTSVITVVATWLLPWETAEARARVAAVLMPSPDAIAHEVAVYRSGWLEQMSHRVPAAFHQQTAHFLTRGFWEMTGFVLIGMGLFKVGFLSAVRALRLYAVMVVACFGAGFPLVVLGASRAMAPWVERREYPLVADVATYWGSFFVALGIVSTVVLLCRLGVRWGPLAAVGRMSLSNYIAQTLICTTIFYGHGLGLFGSVSRVGQLGIVVCVWAFQLTASSWWLRRFTQGPLEWAWRSAASGRPAPLLRRDRMPLPQDAH